jgi:peptidoglycan/LPS O-acetylase OafA/YrhL
MIASVGAPAAALSSRRLPALDGLRETAVLLVVICHLPEQFHPWSAARFWLKTFASAGWTGVDLFLALSGFLIIGILWDAKGSSAYFRNFYARRTVRIFPIYYVTAGLMFLLAPPAAGPSAGNRRFGELLQFRRHWVWFCTYDIVLAPLLSIGTALVSWYVLDLPCLRLQRIFPHGGPA